MDRTSAASYSASAVTAAGGALSLNEVVLVLSIVFAALTFLVNAYYQRRKDLRDQKRSTQDSEYHAHRMEALKKDRVFTKSEGDK
ncbi:HP1 family phage holin [Pseudoalteromonas sp. SW0106-04]|uniref:HP1 family phage holin n=1 Tax=Pseudoalteromonas sp. SW0106-04 TaxID=1702169 RepID=UPI0035944F02